MSKNQPEFELQKSICKWLNLQYGNILYLSDTIASVKLTLPQQARNKSIQKKDFKTPDLLIFYPNEKYHGLFIELKSKSPFKKDYTLLNDEHIQAQQKTICQLNELGYFSCFSWSFDMTKNIIEKYINNQL